MHGMIATIGGLWRGEMPLGQVFWTFTMGFGTVLNLLTTALSLAAMAGGVPAPAAVAIHLMPIPYNFIALIGVWRSADDFDGPPVIATAARVIATLWFAIMVVV
jgi:hypothetical protein